MKNRFYTFLSVLLFLFIFSNYSEAVVINKVIAVVNNEIITEHELNKIITAKAGQKKTSTPDTNTRQETLDKLIDEKLLEQIVTKSKIEISEEDLTRAIGGVLQRNRMTLDQLKTQIASLGMSYEEYKKKTEQEIRRIKFINQVIGPQVKITDQDLRDFYQRNQELFRGSHSAHIAEIVIPLGGLATQKDFEQVRETALSIVAKAGHGSNFGELAKQYSKGPNVENGGDLGMLNLKDLSPEIANIVKSLKVGEVTNPILSGNSIVIIKLISLPEISASDFEKTRDDIYSALYDQKIEEALNNHMQKERQKAFIEIR